MEKLRQGVIPEIEEEPASALPDLREIAIEFARKRIREEFDLDQRIIRLHSFRQELDRIINMYSEQLSSFLAVEKGTAKHRNPCAMFETATEDTIFSAIMKEGRNLCSLRNLVNDGLKNAISGIMPNACDLAGEEISLDMLSAAGSLKKLAELPSGSIQVMGAEKALFKHKREGSPSPKHGFIFKYPGISVIPRGKRGKVARFIASRLAIAFRADYFGRKIDTEQMKLEIKRRITQ
ncbi:MAG: hypothetical protein M1454_03375 [Candidatus Thermoplasmatota archaeon]|nr:hypothetical protein [Candidatus Thermoplasmatota archaeon]MCL5730555.1 hypothetical protein [Candidatus Thermoplasmatota archaeon]